MPLANISITNILLRFLATSSIILAMSNACAADEAKTISATVTVADTKIQTKSDAKSPESKPLELAPQEAVKIQQVEITAKAKDYDARRYDTATKIIVSQEEIAKYGDSTIAEVLKRQPGITIGGIQGRGGEIRMRGLGSGYTQILLNGDPSPPGFSLDMLPPAMVERIEIIRSATADLSAQSVAGTINIVLKKSVQAGISPLIAGGQSENGKIGAAVNLIIPVPLGPVKGALIGTLLSGQYQRPQVVTSRADFDTNGKQTLSRMTSQDNHGQAHAVNFSPRFTLNLGEGQIITSQSFFSAFHINGNMVERTETLFGTKPDFSDVDKQTRALTVTAKTDISWAKKLAGGAKLDAKFGLNRNHSSAGEADSLLMTKSQTFLQRQIDVDTSDKGIIASGKYSTPYAQDHALAIGWDGGVSHRSEGNFQHDDVAVDGTALPVNIDQDFNASIKRFAMYAQDEWNVTPRWSVYYGLRWEGLDTASESALYKTVDNRSSVWSPVFQTLWKLPESKSDQVRFGTSHTYKAPATSTLIPRRIVSNNNRSDAPDAQGNPDLKPELAWGLDLSYEHFLPDGGLMSASTYVRRISDKIRTPVEKINGRWVAMPINDGVALSRGLELEAKLPLRSLVKTAPEIDMRANLSRNWSTISTVPGPNNRLDQQTPFSGNLGLDYKMSSIPLTLGGSYSFQSGGPVNISENQSAYSAPKRVLDMYALLKVVGRAHLRLSFANALHQDNIVGNDYVVKGEGASRATTTTPTSVVIRAVLELKY